MRLVRLTELAVLVFILLFSFPLNIKSKTFACRYDSDSLFRAGNAKQLNFLHGELSKIIERAKRDKEIETVAELSALLCENMMALGQYKDAMIYGQQSLDIYKKLINTPKYSSDINLRYNYALVLTDMAKLNSALMQNIDTTLKLYSQSIDEYNAWIKLVVNCKDANVLVQQEERVDYIDYIIHQTLFMLNLLGHNYVGAAEEGEKMIKTLEKIYPEDYNLHPEYADAMLMMAEIYIKVQDFELTIDYAKRGRNIIEKIYGKNNTTYAFSLYLLCQAYYLLNDLKTASELYRQSIAIYDATGHFYHASKAEIYELGGSILISNGDFINSASLYNSALDVIKRSCGDNCYHIYLNKCFSAYPLLYLGKYEEAAQQLWSVLNNETFLSNLTGDYILSAFALYFEISRLRREYNDVFKNIEEVEKCIKFMKGKFGHSAIINLYVAIGRAYQACNLVSEACAPFGKSQQVLREMAHQNFSFLSEEKRNMFWERDKSRFESILCQNMTATNDGKSELGELLFDASLLQKSLLLNASVNMARVVEEKAPENLKKKMRKLRLMMQSTLETEEQIAACQKLEAEVQQEARRYGDFMDFADFTWKDVKKALSSQDVVVEFVCSETNYSETYSAEILDQSMKAPYHVFLFSNIKKQQLSTEELSKQLVKSIEFKVLPHIKKGSNLYFAPAGQLHVIPIEYMELANGKRMNEIYHVSRVSSTRQVIAKRNKRTRNKEIALFGGLNYNISLDDMELQAMATNDRNRSTMSNTSLWSYLPGTMNEVTNISSMLKKASYKVNLFTQDAGVEESVKALSESDTGIIHIATHGFYRPSSNNSLASSGLIFSGANNFWNGTTKQEGLDDGVLTSEEIAKLNLMKTDLVVLSACQTGLGNISGEGVFGLQRAFKKAGVQSILMSLWDVDDEATQLLMTTFYQNLILGDTKSVALRKAQDKVRLHTFVRNGKEISGTDPRYWAAFILID